LEEYHVGLLLKFASMNAQPLRAAPIPDYLTNVEYEGEIVGLTHRALEGALRKMQGGAADEARKKLKQKSLEMRCGGVVPFKAMLNVAHLDKQDGSVGDGRSGGEGEGVGEEEDSDTQQESSVGQGGESSQERGGGMVGGRWKQEAEAEYPNPLPLLHPLLPHRSCHHPHYHPAYQGAPHLTLL
jgi:hypothetical protein